MKKILKENTYKNILLILILISFYFPIKTYLTGLGLDINPDLADNLLWVSSLIAVIACFGNFEFKYEKVDLSKASHRLLAHFISGSFTLIIGICLIFTSITLSIIVGQFIIMDLTFLLLYVACISYDRWDVYQIKNI
ncbi:hypothetical protein GOV14_01605 [Candidatus Pacearchaeota archaeon]|nr:hypothetical protein [Candidatus Pacearchaeota archaeon]